MFKQIKAVIEPGNLDEVQEALEELGIQGVTLLKCKSFSPQKGPTMIFRGKKQAADLLSEIRLELIVEQEMAGKVIEILQKAEKPSKERDWSISILPIEEVVPLETTGHVGHPPLGVGT
jgi:nitrogen regulatory protein PII